MSLKPQSYNRCSRLIIANQNKTEHRLPFKFQCSIWNSRADTGPLCLGLSKQKWQLLVPLTQNKNMKLFPVVSCFTVGVYSHAFDMAILTVHSWAQYIIHPEVEIYSSPLHYKMLYMCTPFNTSSFTPMMPFFIKRTTCLLYVCLGLSSVSAEMGLPITITVEEFKKALPYVVMGLELLGFTLRMQFTWKYLSTHKGWFISDLIFFLFLCVTSTAGISATSRFEEQSNSNARIW